MLPSHYLFTQCQAIPVEMTASQHTTVRAHAGREGRGIFRSGDFTQKYHSKLFITTMAVGYYYQLIALLEDLCVRDYK